MTITMLKEMQLLAATEKCQIVTVAHPGFPRRRAQTPGFREKTIIWKDFCRNLHENERNWAKRGSIGHLLDLPMCKYFTRWICSLLILYKISDDIFQKPHSDFF